MRFFTVLSVILMALYSNAGTASLSCPEKLKQAKNKFFDSDPNNFQYLYDFIDNSGCPVDTFAPKETSTTRYRLIDTMAWFATTKPLRLYYEEGKSEAEVNRVLNESAAFITYLLEKGADPNLVIKDEDGLDVTTFLTETIKNVDRRKALSRYGTYAIPLYIVENLGRAHNIDPNIAYDACSTCFNDHTALNLAIDMTDEVRDRDIEKHFRLVKSLLELGADPNFPKKSWQGNPYDEADLIREPDLRERMLNLLISYGADEPQF